MTGSASGGASGASGCVDTSGVSGSYTGANYPPATGDWAYPFDPTGQATSNHIPNEIQTVSVNVGSNYNFIIPSAAPFYRKSMVVYNSTTGQKLDEGVDYVCAYKFIDASTSIGAPIYGAIQFLNLSQSMVVRLDYQTIGGAWVVPQNQLTAMLANITSNPQQTSWDQVADLPYQFPPINHEFNLVNLKGFDCLVAAVEGLGGLITGYVASGSNQPTEPGNYLAAGTTFEVSCSDNLNDYIVTLSNPTTVFSIDTPVVGVGQVRRITLLFVQGGSGSNVVEWPDNITWATGASGQANGPDLSTEVGTFDVIELMWANASMGWMGFIAS
jgi:hypothetical protein